MTRLGSIPTLGAVLAASIFAGWVWSSLGLPLGWLMGAALATGIFAMSGVPIQLPKLPHRAGMVLIGGSVGLALSPDVAGHLLGWAPVMLFAALLGMALACIAAPIFARLGRVSTTTAYFCLLPGGVIEMARIGEDNGADPTAIAAVHAVRVALVVGILPIALFSVYPFVTHAGGLGGASLSLPALALVCAVGGMGGWIGHRLRLPAPWLIGAVLSVGFLSISGRVSGTMPPELLAAAQVVVGMALGARFERRRIAAIPHTILAAIPILGGIIALMAAAGALMLWAVDDTLPALVLAFSIGGMAEMVLTAKELGQNAVMVAAFQTVRAIIVNGFASTLWRLIGPRLG